MADTKKDTRVTQTPADAGGIEGGPADTPSIKGAETVDIAAAGPVVLTSKPKRSADQSSSPGGEAFPEDPPVRTTRPDVPIVQSLATGAGQHVPPSLDDYTPDGRVRDLPGQD